jgi:NADPH-dependent 2,4-dienoyl-CoA reductase/sulfur reductase-like enzyme
MAGAALADIVVVGASLAGMTAAHELRRLGYTGRLTVVGDEAEAYQRPPLSKELLLDENGEEFSSILIPSGDFDHRTGLKAVGLDTSRRIVRLEDGSTVPFDGLVIATGESAKRLETDHDHLTLRTTADVLALRARLQARQSMIVVGGGFLGTEIASIASALGVEVSVLSLTGALDTQLGPELSAVITDAAKAQGVSVLTSSRASEVVARDDGRCTVRLNDGSAASADFAVVAIGSHPNVGWLTGSGLALAADGGVVVDARGRAAEGIVAAGDVAAFPTPGGAHARTPYFTSAVEQARVAAATLLGVDAPAYVPTPYFWTSAFGMYIKIAGAIPPAGVLEEAEGSLVEGSALLRWVDRGRVTTAASVNYKATPVKLRRMIGQEAVERRPADVFSTR